MKDFGFSCTDFKSEAQDRQVNSIARVDLKGIRLSNGLCNTSSPNVRCKLATASW